MMHLAYMLTYTIVGLNARIPRINIALHAPTVLV
jgi:hypothetical protein